MTNRIQSSIYGLVFVLCATATVISQEKTEPPIKLPSAAEATELDAVLKDANRSVYDKTYACKTVAQKGTAASVPVLARYLADETLSHPARMALLQIPGEEARNALVKALADSKNARMTQGLLRTIGLRRENASIAAIVPFLADKDDGVFRAACDALGLNAGANVEQPLADAWKTADAKRRETLAAPLFACAGKYIAENRASDALRVYRLIAATKGISRVTLGKATQGVIVTTTGAEQAAVVRNAIKANDGQLALAVAQTMGRLDRDELAQALIDEFAKADLPRKYTLLAMLTRTQSEKARQFIFTLVTTPGDVEFRCKALAAYAPLGRAEDLRPLLESAQKASTGKWDVVVAHLVCLNKIPDPKMDPMVVEMLEKNEGFLRSFMLNLGYGRRIHAGMPVYRKDLLDKDRWNRYASRDAIVATAEVADLEPLIDLLPKASADARVEVLQAINGAVRRNHDTKAVAEIVARKIGAFSKADKLALLEPLAATNDALALEKLVEFAKGSNVELQGEAIRVLGGWTNTSAAPALREIAAAMSPGTLQYRAIRAYIRIARQMEMGADQRINMLKKILPIISRNEELNLLVEAAGRAQWKPAFMFVVPYLENEATRETACGALVAQAIRLDLRDPDVNKWIQRVVEMTKAEATRQTAKDLLHGIPLAR